MYEPDWVDIDRPGYLGRHRDQRHAEWDAEYGEGNWHLAWQVGDIWVPWGAMCMLYEDAYYEYLKNHPDTLDRLCRDASDVYDDDPSNMDSGFDYSRQETDRTHVQDIAVRRCLIRHARWFQGTEPVQIRDSLGDHPLSVELSPGKVPFHKPDLLIRPEMQGWWDYGTVESFYQSNKYLRISRAVWDRMKADEARQTVGEGS